MPGLQLLCNNFLDRIKNLSDTFERIFDLKTLKNANEKYNEHIVNLRKFVWRHRDELIRIQLHHENKPSLDDIEQTVIEDIQAKFVSTLFYYEQRKLSNIRANLNKIQDMHPKVFNDIPELGQILAAV